jgi:UDP:flavonoid glycosyltransferase YjiC (YdhE family)
MRSSAEVRQRIQTSPRVRRLMAAALRAASPAFGLSLSKDEALLLAQVGDVRLALEQLVAKAKVRRALPGAPPVTNEGQQTIAVGEVLAESQGTLSTAEDRRLLRAQLVQRQTENECQIRRANGAARQIEAMIGEKTQTDRVQRRFFRNAALLRMQQRNRLQAEIVDSERRENAMNRLDDLYLAFLTQAHNIVTSA